MKQVSGFYGSGKTKTTVFYYRGWYVCKGSVNVNRTRDEVEDGVNVEELNDYDIFTWNKPINTLNQLVKAVEA
jgi:hypothetical protein